MYFDENTYLMMESYLFNFINVECDLMINMYEEEYVGTEKLPNLIKIIDRMMNNCDDEKILKLAQELRKIINEAIVLKTFVGFCF